MELEELNQLVQRFWQALRSAPFDTESGNLSRFPDECCHHASILFAIYLLRNCSEECEVVSATGVSDPNTTHVWLELGNVIIDLTCGQFASTNMPHYFVGIDCEFYRLRWERIDANRSRMDAERAERLLSGWYRTPCNMLLRELMLQSYTENTEFGNSRDAR